MDRIAVVTNGEDGDSPGVNAAIRAVVKTAVNCRVEPYVVLNGFQGLSKGEIRNVDKMFVSGILEKGGTVLGSSLVGEFNTSEGRRKVAYNLLKNRINKLVVISGERSLINADIMRKEWHQYLKEFAEQKEIDEELLITHSKLYLAGLIGSPDNNFCDTELAIGADTALHRILEAIDAIVSTASSHQRSFVIEILGKQSGWLTVMAALASGSDYILIPERPPHEGWEAEMCALLEKGRSRGRRCSLVLVSEGAVDIKGNPISSSYVRDVLEKKAGQEARYTVLGYLQRGGTPSVIDRIMGSRMGVAAVGALVDPTNNGEPYLIVVNGNNVFKTPLEAALHKTVALGEALKNLDFETAMSLRGKAFCETYEMFKILSGLEPHPPRELHERLRIAVMHCGGPSSGMNSAVRALRLHTQLSMTKTSANGFAGLVKGSIREMTWMSVNGWAVRGGAELGTNRVTPNDGNIKDIADNIRTFKIDVLVMFGGYDGYRGVLHLQDYKSKFPAVDIPLLCIPGTIANNLPGTELSIGADTALNNIVMSIDKIKHSGVASRRVNFVEVMGSDCGYLALMSSLATGAEKAYFNEQPINLEVILKDIETLTTRFLHGAKVGLIITTEAANKTYTTAIIHKLFKRESNGAFDVRESILGHLQQGGDPSAWDRMPLIHRSPQIKSGTFGFLGGEIGFTPIEKLAGLFHAHKRRPKYQWWESLIPVDVDLV